MSIVSQNRPPTSSFSPFPAHQLPPHQRQQLAIHALAHTQPISQLAQQHHVSRKFVYQQVHQAHQALQHSFDPPDNHAVLFHLPVTQAWIEQLVLGLILVCHSSYRGVVEFLDDLFDFSLSVGTVHNIIYQAIPLARQHNQTQNLSGVRIGAHDEIFQANQPVLVGCDAESTYCYLLASEEHRDGDTWAVRLLELVERGFSPDATIADQAKGLRTGQQVALPGVPCRGDVFHALHQITPVVRFLENQAYQAIAKRIQLEKQLARPGKRRDQNKTSWQSRLVLARKAETQAIALAEDVALLMRWLQEDILAVAGADHAGRVELYEFICGELQRRESLCPHRIGPLGTALANQREDLLAFVKQLDNDLQELAQAWAVPVEQARALLQIQSWSRDDSRRGPTEAALRNRFGSRYPGLSRAVEAVRESVVRASSVVENLNSRLRSYFSLRRMVGVDYLALLQFYLNHRRFQRSERAFRVGKSPRELLTGEKHRHWLELLGYQRFRRN